MNTSQIRKSIKGSIYDAGCVVTADLLTLSVAMIRFSASVFSSTGNDFAWATEQV
jgi:type 1 fimbria pilin